MGGSKVGGSGSGSGKWKPNYVKAEAAQKKEPTEKSTTKIKLRKQM